MKEEKKIEEQVWLNILISRPNTILSHIFFYHVFLSSGNMIKLTKVWETDSTVVCASPYSSLYMYDAVLPVSANYEKIWEFTTVPTLLVHDWNASVLQDVKPTFKFPLHESIAT